MSPLEACRGWGSLASDIRDTCKAMDASLMAEKRCSRMGLKIACRGKHGMGKAKSEWQDRTGRQKDLQSRMARKRTEAEDYHNAWCVF